MAIDLNRIKDDTLYSAKEVCELVDIKNTRYLVVLRKQHGIKHLRNGKFAYYKGSEVKKLIKSRLED